MSTTIIHGRSNYFRVKDDAAFAACCNQHGIDSWTETNKDHPGDIFHAISPDENGWPNTIDDPENEGDTIDFDLTQSSPNTSPPATLLFSSTGRALRARPAQPAIQNHA